MTHLNFRRSSVLLAAGVAFVVGACDDSGVSLGDAGATPIGLGIGDAAVSWDGALNVGPLPGTAFDGGTDSGTPVASADSSWCKASAVFQAKCQTCHSSPIKYGAPMPLVTYTDTQAAAVESPGKKVFEAIGARIHDTAKPMPPRDNPQLSPDELATLDSWVTGGGQPGANPTCAPSTVDAGVPPPPAQDWPTNCDSTVKLLAHATGNLNAPFQVPANNQSYQTFILDAPWNSNDVQAIAFRPITDNSKVLHHWILYKNNAGSPGEFLNGWAPGSLGGSLPADVGELMPKGAQSLLLQVHYWNASAGSKVEPDASGVEVCIVNKEHFRPNSAEVFQGFSSLVFSINRGDVNKDVVSNCKVSAPTPVHLLTSSPHMHTLGRHAKLVLKRKDGTVQTLHDAVFDFEDQRSITYPQEIVINTGDTVTTTCTYSFPADDTAHKKNGQLMQTVNFGRYTEDEMCFNFSLFYPAGGLSCGIGF